MEGGGRSMEKGKKTEGERGVNHTRSSARLQKIREGGTPPEGVQLHGRGAILQRGFLKGWSTHGLVGQGTAVRGGATIRDEKSASLKQRKEQQSGILCPWMS